MISPPGKSEAGGGVVVPVPSPGASPSTGVPGVGTASPSRTAVGAAEAAGKVRSQLPLVGEAMSARRWEAS